MVRIHPPQPNFSHGKKQGIINYKKVFTQLKKIITVLLAVCLVVSLACAPAFATIVSSSTSIRKGRLECHLEPLASSDYTYTGSWEVKTWDDPDWFDFYGFWSDGQSIYYSNYEDQYVLNGDTWEPMTWSGLSELYGDYVWSDGQSIYYSNFRDHYVLNGDTWEPMTWSGLSSFVVSYIWSDGTNIYLSDYEGQYILNGDTWEPNTWSGLSKFYGDRVWSDGTNIYYSRGEEQYILNGDTWEPKTWSGLSSFYGSLVWFDGTNIYYSRGEEQYILNGDAWEPMTWSGLSEFDGDLIWSDGPNLYYNGDSDMYVLRGQFSGSDDDGSGDSSGATDSPDYTEHHLTIIEWLQKIWQAITNGFESVLTKLDEFLTSVSGSASDNALRDQTSGVVDTVTDLFYGDDSSNGSTNTGSDSSGSSSGSGGSLKVDSDNIGDVKDVMDEVGSMMDTGFSLGDLFAELSSDSISLWFTAECAQDLDTTNLVSVVDDDDPYNHQAYWDALNYVNSFRGGDD